MIGFPIPDRIGEKSVQIYWIGLALPELTHQSLLVHGFRDPEKAYWWHDQQKLFKKSAEIQWLFTENWDKSELTSRGSFPDDVTTKSALIIGAGSVGSVVSELLVRSGQTQLAIMDGDLLQAGNLVRHTLTLNDINKYKVDSLVNRLIDCSPHNRIKGINKHFPLIEDEQIEIINGYDVILDCTAEDEVIYQLENFPWSPDKTFISISLGYGSKRLFVYMSQGQSFSAQSFFKLIHPWQEKEAQSLIGIEFPREGIGCWHPVFPARSDDVWQMATIAIKNIEMALQQPIIKPKLLVYEQQWNEEVFLGTRLVYQEEYDEG
ncbi:ThiF family adenylyltransferase [Oceanobacillus longus]|uniref:ThiF family adenylyltransferase n=1 Tax=Oceanobacillus longus TaxID=930120 RepID=A0ABV8H0C4_9BACI